jgi:hypothetical protein
VEVIAEVPTEEEYCVRILSWLWRSADNTMKLMNRHVHRTIDLKVYRTHKVASFFRFPKLLGIVPDSKLPCKSLRRRRAGCVRVNGLWGEDDVTLITYRVIKFVRDPSEDGIVPFKTLCAQGGSLDSGNLSSLNSLNTPISDGMVAGAEANSMEYNDVTCPFSHPTLPQEHGSERSPGVMTQAPSPLCIG